MAVSGVSGSGTSIYGSRNVLSGLASGMDTESMIENMTQATRLKIAQQKQKKTLLGWKQTAYQGISTQLIEFSKKYLDYSSPTNLLSSAFYDQSIVTSLGKNNGLVSATGKTNSKIEINGVEKLATSATHKVGNTLPTGNLETTAFDFNSDKITSTLAGGTLTFKYGDKDYTIKLDPNADLTTPDKVAEEINKQLKNTQVSQKGSDEKFNLGDKIEVTLDSQNRLTFGAKDGADLAGNTIQLTGASDAVQTALKLKKDDLKDGINLTTGNFTTGSMEAKDLSSSQPIVDFLKNKKITISLNGQSKEITLLTEEEHKELSTMNKDYTNKRFQDILQDKLNHAFGSGKVSIKADKDGSLAFEVKDPKNDILKVERGDAGVVGAGSVFGFKQGDGNRLNLDATLEELLGKDYFSEDKTTEDLVINGVKIGSYGKDATLGDIMRAMNSNKDASVNASYSEITNQFVITSKDTGSSGKVQIAGGLAEKLFGKTKTDGERGEDAIIYATINGQTQKITRPSNSIDIDGLQVTISGTFGECKADEKGNVTGIKSEETVRFTVKADSEKMLEAVKTMVEDYNKIIDSLYKELKTKPNRDYQPLTDEQKKEMTEEQIEKWEEKAKEGILFADPQLRSLHDSLRFVFNPGGEMGSKLRAMGIEPSSNYQDGGKIKLDETKLKAALEADAEGVKNAFTALASENAEGGIMNSASKGGVMTQLKEVTDRFASTSITKPGILVARAGSPSSPNSMLKNSMKTEMDSIDKILKSLDVKLKKEIDRYNSQFTQLETLISQMNAQSSQLAGFMGGGM